MHFTQLATLFAAYLISSSAVNGLPLHRREVPQEHSHEKYLRAVNELLRKNNPDGILDSVFGLLGNTAALQGIGQISDPDCLHQATADQAFTNAKAEGNVQGMVDSLIFAALERNTGAVGQESVLCTAITAVNPEIAAITQHQDPASNGAAQKNKAITLELARQIAAVGGNPLQALESGTFAPGQIGDPTARGNTCNVLEDPVGCIFTQNLLVPDATEEEILAAVGDVAAPAATETAGADETAAPTTTTDAVATASPTDTCPPPLTVTVTAEPTPVATEAACPTDVVTVTVTAGAGATATAAPEVVPTITQAPPAAPTATAAAAGDNLQKFTEALGNVPAPVVRAVGTQFCLDSGVCFNNRQSAIVRSCDVQNNQCANASNAAGQAKTFSVGDCNQQQGRCIALARSS